MTLDFALQNVRNEQILADLSVALERALPFDGPAQDWTREQALLVLGALRDAVGCLMDRQGGYTDPGVPVILTHPATQLLGQLAAAIGDLKNGNVDPRLAPMEGLGGAGLKVLEGEKVAHWLEVVEILKVSKGMTYLAGRKKVAEFLAQKGERFRDHQVTATQLANWRRYPPGTKRNEGRKDSASEKQTKPRNVPLDPAGRK
jgi:hypothetical protein